MGYDDRTIQQALQDDNRILNQRIEQLKVIERMQKSIVDAGGRFFSADELTEMTIAKFVDQFGSNGVVLTATCEKHRRTK